MKNNITDLRKAKKLSMQALADLAGTTQQQIDRLEKGQRRLTVEWIEKLCGALDCEPQDLVEFSISGKSANKTSTVSAKIIGAIETGFSNMVRPFGKDEVYKISVRGDDSSKLFGLVVEGGKYGKYPEGTELIFNELNRQEKPAGAAEKDGNFIVSKNEKQHQFEIDGKLVTVELIKSIRNE